MRFPKLHQKVDRDSQASSPKAQTQSSGTANSRHRTRSCVPLFTVCISPETKKRNWIKKRHLQSWHLYMQARFMIAILIKEARNKSWTNVGSIKTFCTAQITKDIKEKTTGSWPTHRPIQLLAPSPFWPSIAFDLWSEKRGKFDRVSRESSCADETNLGHTEKFLRENLKADSKCPLRRQHLIIIPTSDNFQILNKHWPVKNWNFYESIWKI